MPVASHNTHDLSPPPGVHAPTRIPAHAQIGCFGKCKEEEEENHPGGLNKGCGDGLLCGCSHLLRVPPDCRSLCGPR